MMVERNAVCMRLESLSERAKVSKVTSSLLKFCLVGLDSKFPELLATVDRILCNRDG